MPAPKEKTRHPGIYKRGSRYVVTFRVNGRQRSESVGTMKEALRMKRERESARDRGEFQVIEEGRMRFREYAEEWIERYQGNGKRGFTEDTRDDYRRDLARYAYPFLDERLGRSVAGITPRDIANWIAQLCDEKAQGRALADGSIRRIVAPVRACLATAKREGLIRHNAADGAVLPHREKIEEADEQRAMALTRVQLDAFLRVVHPRHALMFRFLAATGLRFSELVELRWKDLRLDGSEPCVRVRRAYVRGKVKPPKSRHSRRDVPLDARMVDDLRRRRKQCDYFAPEDFVFSNQAGNRLDHSGTLRRVLRPAAEEAGAPWAGFHSLRHTCASLLFSAGRNAKQVQRWLGHHSPAFTLATYVHLLDDGVGDALDLGAELAQGGNAVATGPAETHRNAPERELAETAV